MWTETFQVLKLDLEKAEEPEMKLPTSVRSQKKQENRKTTSTSASLTTLKPLTVWITTNCRKFLKSREYSQTTLPASWEICMQGKKQQIEPAMEWWTGSKLQKEYIKAVYCHFAYFNLYAGYIMWNAGLDEAQDGIKIARRNINNLRYAEDITLMAESEEKLKSLLMKVKEESEKNWHKTQHSKNKDHGIWSHHFMENRWENNGNNDRLSFGGLQYHCRW